MQLKEALETIHEFSSADLPIARALLVSGFSPVHLQAFFHAELQRMLPCHKVVVSIGLYDDLLGTLARIESSTVDLLGIAIEWPDLDRRLGFRHLGGWGPSELVDVVAGVESRLAAIREHLTAAEGVPVAISMPTLGLPPIFNTPSWQFSEEEARLRREIDDFVLWASGTRNIRVANIRGDSYGPTFDFKGDLIAGLPYTIPHASRVGQVLARLLAPTQPRKGIITDLDETLWAGIVGEVGPDGVSWNLTSKTQLHGLYQQVLRAMAERGVLLGAASKNDPELVEAVFRRPDVLIPRKYLFPVEARWTPKSESVAKILRAWNVHPDSVVFVDDSPSEIAEVKAVYPEMECILFDARDYDRVHTVLYRLRDLFSKHTITGEDMLRRESLRANQAFEEDAQATGTSHEVFLRDSRPRIVFDFEGAASNPRSLELVNKTNQFNLNGIRYTESAWGRKIASPHTFVVTASYTDKYGALGIIAALVGTADTAGLTVNTWVMSCRAFGRRIEHQCLNTLFDHFCAQKTLLEFAPTPRNHFLPEFLKSISGHEPSGPFLISREVFLERCPTLHHEVEIYHE